MTKKMKIEYAIDITADDIKRGIKKSSLSCPLARAIYREIGCCKPIVHAQRAYIYRDTFNINDAGRDFIQQFDKGKKVKPITVKLLKITKILKKSGL